MRIPGSTKRYSKWWRDRKIDWKKEYLSTWNYKHRIYLITALTQFTWRSILEVGCASGPNMAVVLKMFPGADVGGIDINKDAIKVAKEAMPAGYFVQGNCEDILMSDRSSDVVLSDMTMIYVGPFKIKKCLSEMKRVARNKIILVEFHSNGWWQKLKLLINWGYYAHDYGKILKKLGFYDIQINKIAPEAWDNGEPQKSHAYIITASIPQNA